MKLKRVFFVSISSLLLTSCIFGSWGTTSKSSSSFKSSSSSSSNIPSSSSSKSSTSKKEGEYPTDVYGDYYKNCLSWQNGSELKQKLYTAMHDGFVGLKYDGNWDVNMNADEDIYNHLFVDQLYTDDLLLKTDHKSNDNGEGWDREHCFAKTLIMENPDTSIIGPVTDFHNLYAAWTQANKTRSNLNYGEFKPGEKESSSSPVGYNKFSSEKYEPGSNIDKGKVSRAIFYMATMYGDATYGLYLREETCGTGDKCHGNLSDLLNWNDNEVTLGEYKHNDTIYTKYQHNRNPFIDYPELVDYVYGDKKGQPGELKYIEPTYLKLDLGKKELSHYAIKEAKITYNLGDSFNKTDVSMNEVLKDFSYGNPITSFISNINDGFVFNEKGKKDITISYNGQNITYPINVIYDPISKLDFRYKFVSSDFSKTNETDNQTNNVTFNSVLFKETRASLEGSKKVSSQGEKGIQLGTGTYPIEKLTLESVNDFSFNEKNKITSIYFEGNIASGKTADIEFYVDNTKVGDTQTLTYATIGHNTYGVTLDNPKQGKVKIIVTLNNDCAVFAYRIGVGVTN